MSEANLERALKFLAAPAQVEDALEMLDLAVDLLDASSTSPIGDPIAEDFLCVSHTCCQAIRNARQKLAKPIKIPLGPDARERIARFDHLSIVCRQLKSLLDEVYRVDSLRFHGLPLCTFELLRQAPDKFELHAYWYGDRADPECREARILGLMFLAHLIEDAEDND